ncbi:MAG: AAA family ATPase, partial [Kofleriaceae bacterium]
MTDISDLIGSDARELTGDARATGDKTFGRQDEVHALARLLANKKSVVLVGPHGVGKTAVIQKLLSYLTEGRLPELAGARVYEVSTTLLCSDTRYTGMQESRIRALLAFATPLRIHYVSDVWNLPSAGSYDTKPRGIYDLMRPGIEGGSLVVVGECTPGRWDKLCRDNPELVRDFVQILVAEPTEAETRDLMARVVSKAGFAFDRPAVDRAYSLAKKFLPSLSFPGKGVELLRRAAEVAASPQQGTPVRTAPIDASFVEAVFGEATGLPMHMISATVRMTYDDMHAFLADRVLGQDEAVAAVADLLALYKTGLKDPDRPAGVLLFVGPTGVGKTELAKATTEFLFGKSDRMLRIDMSEYKDYHSFEKLIGDPKHEKAGVLTDHVRKHPFSVVLLDEFEKGHANLADLFLQVFDDGRLTDATGDTVDFRHAIIILTSNVGSKLRDLTSSMGFGDRRPGDMPQDRELGRDVRRALEATYRPEFLNRIDRILVFHALNRKDMRRIAQRELGKVYGREGLLDRDLLLEVDEGVLDLLLDRGFDPHYGARPLKRAIEELVVLPLARALLETPVVRFQLLRTARRGDRLELTFEDTDVSRKLVNLERRLRVDDGDGHVVKLSLAEVRGRLAETAGRLAHLEATTQVAARRRELAELEVKAQTPGAWGAAFGKGGEVYRRHQIAIDLRRADDLRERLELLHKLVEAILDEGEDVVADELIATFARLDRDLVRAERELVSFDDRDRGDAWIRLRGAGAKDGAADWAKQLATMYARWAEAHEYEAEVVETAGSIDVLVKGTYAFGYLKAEAGGHRLLANRGAGRDRRAETLLARVEVRPLLERNTPGSAREVGGDDEAPVRTYDLLSSRGVRDRRTGHVEGDVRKVLEGRLEGFLDAA